MGMSIDRMAMEIAAKPAVAARDTLKRFGFSPAEAGEICKSHWRRATNTIDPDWGAISMTIRSTMECSVRIGDRIDMAIG